MCEREESDQLLTIDLREQAQPLQILIREHAGRHRRNPPERRRSCRMTAAGRSGTRVPTPPKPHRAGSRSPPCPSSPVSSTASSRPPRSSTAYCVGGAALAESAEHNVNQVFSAALFADAARCSTTRATQTGSARARRQLAEDSQTTRRLSWPARRETPRTIRS